jgi:hypothetical protein
MMMMMMMMTGDYRGKRQPVPGVSDGLDATLTAVAASIESAACYN